MKGKAMVNRRGFLGLAASFGACGFSGCAGFPSVTSTRSPNGQLRLGCIGCGAQGSSDIASIATHRRIEMAAFCDVDLLMLNKLRTKYPKARFYQNWREMLDREQLDAALVATPDHSHCEIMSEVLRRGLNLHQGVAPLREEVPPRQGVRPLPPRHPPLL